MSVAVWHNPALPVLNGNLECMTAYQQQFSHHVHVSRIEAWRWLHCKQRDARPGLYLRRSVLTQVLACTWDSHPTWRKSWPVLENHIQSSDQLLLLSKGRENNAGGWLLPAWIKESLCALQSLSRPAFMHFGHRDFLMKIWHKIVRIPLQLVERWGLMTRCCTSSYKSGEHENSGRWGFLPVRLWLWASQRGWHRGDTEATPTRLRHAEGKRGLWGEEVKRE